MTAETKGFDHAEMQSTTTTVFRRDRRDVRDRPVWIAAIATSRGLPIVNKDGDFDALDAVAGLTVIRV